VSSKGEKKEGGNHGKRNEKRRKGENKNERKTIICRFVRRTALVPL
jgi:hypothetical protein